MTETTRTTGATGERVNGKLDEVTAQDLAQDLARDLPMGTAETGIPPLDRKRARRGGRRILTALLTTIAAALMCSIGAVLGYTQGPAVATLLASGQTFAQIGAEFQSCFAAASNDQSVRSFFRLFFGNRNRPTATPGPRPTLDPTLARVVRGTLVEFGATNLIVQTAEGLTERLNIFPLMQIVSDTGHKMTRRGVLAGDGVRVLALRANALGPFGALGGAQGGATPEPGQTPPPVAPMSADTYAALCVIVNVSPVVGK